MFTEVSDVLAVMAHPDDEVLGCGGFLARLNEENKSTYVLLLGGVTTSRYDESPDEEEWKKNEFEGEAPQASDVLGVTDLYRCDFDDNRFDKYPLLKIIKEVEKVKEQVNPDLVITHDHDDLNVDHRLTQQAVLTAFRPEPGKKKVHILGSETLTNSEWQNTGANNFKPNFYVDITDQFDVKKQALGAYESELREYPHPRSMKGLEYHCGRRGTEAGVEYAEAFRVLRSTY